MENDKIVNGNCWAAYFDILGFKEFVLGFDDPENPHCYGVFVAELYNHMLESFSEYTCGSRVFTAWFSDTFLLYTADDSYESFVSIAHRAASLCSVLVARHRPVRGSLGTGRLYAEQEKSIFIGSALIDAYKYGEKQNWIGFVMTPKAEDKFNSIPKDDGRKKTPWGCCDYCKYDVPMKGGHEKLWTAKIGRFPGVREVINQGANGSNEYREKYKNTLDFIDECSDPRFTGLGT